MKREAGPLLRKFVPFIETQIEQIVKCIRMNQVREFGVYELKAWQAEKNIKIEISFGYSPDINGIAERTNCLTITKHAACYQTSI